MELSSALIKLLGSEELVELWWKTQNREFGYKTPKETYIINPSKVITYIMTHINSEGS